MYSREILEAIFTCQELNTRPLKLTLLYLARYAQPDGSQIWPGEIVAAHDLCIGVRQFERDMRRLVEGQWLLPDGKKGYVNKYKVNREKLGLPATPPKPKIRGRTVLEPIPEKPEENISNGRNEHKPPEKTGQENAEDARIWRYKSAVFQYYGALAKKGFANTQEMETYTWARDQLMQLGISEEKLMREYENEKIGVR